MVNLWRMYQNMLLAPALLVIGMTWVRALCQPDCITAHELEADKMSISQQDVYVVDGARTPFLKARGRPGVFAASDLACVASTAVLSRQSISLSDIDEVILGCMMPSENEANIARLVALRLGCDVTTPAWTVQRNCGSGMQALDSAYQRIASGHSQCVLAGGTEAMSRAPFLWRPELMHWFADLRAAKTMTKKLQCMTRLKARYLRPIVALLKGLCDPSVAMNMGQTAELISHEQGISREAMDYFAVQSHQRLASAIEQDLLAEVVPLITSSGQAHHRDDGVRPDSSLEALSRLKPIFESPFGCVTAGNSSQVTDGAAMCLLASADFVAKHDLQVLGKIRGCDWAAGPPEKMGLGPVWSSQRLLQQHGMRSSDIDFWEINEAFAGQVLSCLSESQFENRSGQPLSENLSTVNIHGGAIACGHPVGASGARIVLHLLHVLAKHDAQLGVATLCVGGGQGGAMLLERGGVR